VVHSRPVGIVRISLVAGLLALGGCCLSVTAGTNLNELQSTSGTTGGGGTPTGTGAGTSSGTTTGAGSSSGPTSSAGNTSGSSGTAPSCVPGPASNLGSYATYTSLPLVDLSSADLNGDGMLDLVAFNFPADDLASDASFVVFFGQPDGGLGAPVSYAGGFPRCIGDLNGDGHPDVVVENFDNVGVQIFLNDGAGGLVLSGAAMSSEYVIGCGIGDINGDGLADLVFAEEGPGTHSSAELALGNGLGDFSSPTPLNLGYPLVVADLDQNGISDIVGNTSDGTQLAVLLNEGEGDFRTKLYANPAISDIALLFKTGAAPDLVLGQNGYLQSGALVSDGGVQVLENSGDGTFLIGAALQVQGGEIVAIGDFNGDCIPDIATSSPGTGCASWQASVLYGKGDGGFAPAVSLQAIGFVGSLAALGPVENPRALAADTGRGCIAPGIVVYGDASRP